MFICIYVFALNVCYIYVVDFVLQMQFCSSVCVRLRCCSFSLLFMCRWIVLYVFVDDDLEFVIFCFYSSYIGKSQWNIIYCLMWFKCDKNAHTNFIWHDLVYEITVCMQLNCCNFALQQVAHMRSINPAQVPLGISSLFPSGRTFRADDIFCLQDFYAWKHSSLVIHQAPPPPSFSNFILPWTFICEYLTRHLISLRVKWARNTFGRKSYSS